MKKLITIFLALTVAAMCAVTTAPAFAAVLPEEGDWDYGKKYTIVNPYESVDWATVNHVKSALHVHTSNSGIVWNDVGLTAPEAVIAAYKSMGFGAVVLTDHDYVGYPWRDGNSYDPPTNVNYTNDDVLTMAGNELSKNAHMLSYGSRYMDTYDPNNIKNQSVTAGYDQNITNISQIENIFGETGAYVYLAHPRRNDPNEAQRNKAESVSYSDLWWLSKFMNHDNAIGLEVLNCGQFSRNHSERLWDSLLSKSMPERFIFGTASDDNHGSTSLAPVTNLGTGWTNVLISDENMNNRGLYDGLKAGLTYFSTYMMVHDLNGPNDDNKARPEIPQPKIHSITVDNEAGTISIETDYTSKVEWISGVDEDNKESRVVLTDRNAAGSSANRYVSTICVEQLQGLEGYIRARIIGDGGQTHCQPFGLKKYYRTLEVSDTDYSVDYAAETISFDPEKLTVSSDSLFTQPIQNGGTVTAGQELFMRWKTDTPEQECVVLSVILSERPATPKASLSTRNETTITLSAVNGGQCRMNGGEWQDSFTFRNLTPNTEYTFDIRIKPTETQFASEIATTRISTKEGSSYDVGCNSRILGDGGLLAMLIVVCVLVTVGIRLIRRRKSE